MALCLNENRTGCPLFGPVLLIVRHQENILVLASTSLVREERRKRKHYWKIYISMALDQSHLPTCFKRRSFQDEAKVTFGS